MLTPPRMLCRWAVAFGLLAAALGVAGFHAGRWSTRPPESVAVPGTFSAAPRGVALRGDLLVVTLPPGGCPAPVELRHRGDEVTVRVLDPFPGLLCEFAEEPRTFAVRVDPAELGSARRDVRVRVVVESRDRPMTREYTVEAE
jgi:hypothetical protein